MTPSQSKKIKKLGLLTTAQAEKLGINRPELSRLVKSGMLLRVGRGIYLHRTVDTSSDIGFRIACSKFGPKAVIGGLSALFYYNLIEQVPQQTWLIVSPDTRTKDKSYRLMRTKAPLDVGVIKKNGFKIVTVERALVEALKFASKIGDRTAIGAVRKAIAQKMTNEAKLGRVADELGLLSAVQRFIEAIAA
jgi:predicted transcriptional regulator of viral defense system